MNDEAISIRTPSLSAEGEGSAEAIRRDLAEQAGIDPVDVNIEDVGPTWGGEISRKAAIGLVVVLAAIMAYITLRFELKMAIGAIIALIHDVIITIGVYALTGREVTPETVIAVLTILGFSLYDTVVIYDKIKENLETQSLVGRLGSDGTIDLSLNQVLMRSVNTSLVVLLPILSLLLFGGETLKDFAFAMFIGTAIGVYSSIFLAAPLLAVLKKREARFRQLEQKLTDRERVVARRATAAPRRRPVRAPARRPPPARPPGPRRPGDPDRSRSGASRRPSASGGEVVEIEQIKALIRDVPDFPEPGIVFKDITPILAHADAMSTIIDLIVVHFGRGTVDKVVGIEARGFILAAPVAYHFNAGFVPIRKQGKLPWETASEEYALEYGTATLELHRDAIEQGERVLIVDDVLATGGTAQAAASLVERCGGAIRGISCLIELEFLKGRSKLEDYEVHTFIQY